MKVNKNKEKRTERRRQRWSNSLTPTTQRSQVQKQTHWDQGPSAQFISEQEVIQCTFLPYGAHISNESRSLEFKEGGGNYFQNTFYKHVCMYGCAFLNSCGGSLLVGVSDSGLVHGVNLSHYKEDGARLNVDNAVKSFNPPLLPCNYSLDFLPVMRPAERNHELKVLRLTFTQPKSFTEPILFQAGPGQVYLRRDGSVQGPLAVPFILQWFDQMWSRRVKQLQQQVHQTQCDWWFVAGQLWGLQQSIGPLHRTIASLETQNTEAHNGPSSSSAPKSDFPQPPLSTNGTDPRPADGTKHSERKRRHSL